MAALPNAFSLRPFNALFRDRMAVSIWATSIGSWAVLFAWSESPYSALLGHSELGGVTSAAGFLSLFSVFLLGWAFMVLAMALPNLVPLIREFRRKNAMITTGAGTGTIPLIIGALAVWVPFGVSVYLIDLGIHRASDLPPLQGNTWFLGFSSLLLAGIYQFTRTKYEFLKDCCYPADFLRSRRQNGTSSGGALKTGLSYGRLSLGSHWALMLLMFSLGLQGFPPMLVLGLAMIGEHLPRIGPRIRMPIGFVIMALAFSLGAVSGGL